MELFVVTNCDTGLKYSSETDSDDLLMSVVLRLYFQKTACC